MPMFGDADIWLGGLSVAEKSTFESLLNSLKSQYGGENDKMSQAIHTLEKIQQGTEPMVTFGPRLRNLIMNVCPNNTQLQLHYFNRAVHPSVYESVRPSRPGSLSAAISFALELERNFQQPISKNKTGGAPTSHNFGAVGTWNLPSTVASPDDPMEDVQQNAQRYKQYHNKKKFSGNSGRNSYNKDKRSSSSSVVCNLCKKTGHVINNCHSLKKASDILLTSSKGKKSHHNSSQSIVEKKHDLGSIKHKMINSEDIDLTKNLFYQIGGYNSNSQSRQVDSLPSFFGGGDIKSGNSFVLPIELGDQDSECLIDTGADISTITNEEADALNLRLVEASPMAITYGNNSRGVSNYKAWVEVQFPGIKTGIFYLRVVPVQNYRIILGMDWFCCI